LPCFSLSLVFSFPLFFLVLQRAFFYFLCTVSGCDGGNRIRNIAMYTWRFSPLSYDRHPLSYDRHPLSYDRHPSELRPSPTELRPSSTELRPSPNWATTVTLLSYDRHPTELRPSPWYSQPQCWSLFASFPDLSRYLGILCAVLFKGDPGPSEGGGAGGRLGDRVDHLGAGGRDFSCRLLVWSSSG
jgi:hypothetical protein